MAQGQLLESTWSFEIFSHGSKYLLVSENWWDVEKISSRLDNGNSTAQPCFALNCEDVYIRPNPNSNIKRVHLFCLLRDLPVYEKGQGKMRCLAK